MLKIVLVDDEQHALNQLEYLIKKFDRIEVVGMFTDPIEALENIEYIHPDAVFLDIDMPVMNGLNLAREIADIDKNIYVVFTTAFDDYAVKAFEVQALDYILKPLQKDRLGKTLENLISKKESLLFKNEQLQEKISSLEKDSHFGLNKITVFDGEEYDIIPEEDVLYIEAQIKDTLVVSKNGSYKTRKNMEAWESRLKFHGFFRCHRSYIVNLKYVKKLSPMFNNNFVIKLQESRHEVPVSKSRIKELKSILGID